jgi:hypothetical protein
MKRLLILLLFVPYLLGATNYYVSTSGSSGNNGTSTATPWNLAKLNTEISLNNLGSDSIFLKRGDVFYGTITINGNKSAGTYNQRTYYGAYGTGEKPIITGLQTLSSWTSEGGGIWSASYTHTATDRLGNIEPLNGVLKDGVMMKVGRIPKTGLYTYSSATTTSIVSTSVNSAVQNWTGAEVAIRKNNWTFARGNISGHSGNTLTYSSLETSTPKSGAEYGFFVQRHLACVTQEGDWFHDATANKLYVHFGANNPASYTMQVTTTRACVYMYDTDYVTFENIEFEGSNTYLFYNDRSDRVTVRNCTFTNAGTSGYHSDGATIKTTLDGNTFNTTNATAILSSRWGNSTTDSMTVINNDLYDIALTAGMGGREHCWHTAIDIESKNCTIMYNRIYECGYIGINGKGQGVKLNRNYVLAACQVLNDGAGVYTWINRASYPTATDYNNEMMYNIVIGNSASDGHGTYTDDGSNYWEVAYNLSMGNGRKGHHGNDNQYNNIHHNKWINNKGGGFSAQNLGNVTGVSWLNNTIENNVITPGAVTPFVYEMRDVKNNPPTLFANLGTIDNNYLLGYDDAADIANRVYLYPSYSDVDLSYAQWLAAGFDESSDVVDDTEMEVYYNVERENSPITFTGYKKTDAYGNDYYNSITLEPFESVVFVASEELTGNYYVSNSGDDDNDGLTPETAWATLSKVASMNIDGDSVLLKRGDTFIPVKFNVATNLKIGAYGSGANPLINGLYEVTGFTQVNDSLYSKVITTGYPQYLIFNNSLREKGSFPRTGYYLLDNVSGDNLTASELDGYNFTGGEIVVDFNQWSVGTNPINSHDGSTVNATIYGFGYIPKAGNPFTVQNHPSIFRQIGDWAYIHDTLFVHSENDISNHSIKISLCDTLFSVRENGSVSINNVDIIGIDNLLFESDSYGGIIKIDNSNIRFTTFLFHGRAREGGIFVNNSEFTDIIGQGFRILGWSPSTKPDTIIFKNNVIKRWGLVRGLGNFLDSWLAMVALGGSNNYCEFSNNRIDSMAYNGISAAASVGKTKIFNNYISNTNLRTIDGGAIHIGPGEGTNDTIFVYNNICDNTRRGIYMDNGAKNWQIHDNLTMNGAYSGYFSNSAKYTDVYDNIFWNNARGAFVRKYDTYGQPTDLKLYNNIIYTTGTNYPFVYYAGTDTVDSYDWSDVGFGLIDTNIYISESASSRYYISGGGLTGTSYTISQYQALGYDVNSSEILLIPELQYNATMSPKTINFSGYTKTDARGNTYRDSITLQPFESVVFILSAAKTKAKYIFTKHKVRDTHPSVYNDAAAYYPLRGNANDLTGNAPGTVYGATATVDRFNLANKALSFDGVDDYVQSNAKFGEGDFTVSFWFKFDELPAVGAFKYFITKFSPPSNRMNIYYQQINASNQQLQLLLINNNISISTGKYGGLFIVPNVFYNVTVTLNGNTARMYLNNVLIGQNTNFTNRVTPAIDAVPLRLAEYNTNYMKVNLSDFAIWQRALSDAERTAIYNEKAVYKNKPLRGVDGKIITTLK